MQPVEPFLKVLPLFLKIFHRKICVELRYWKSCSFRFREVVKQTFIIEYILRNVEAVTLQESTIPLTCFITCEKMSSV